jgi:molecular chaperone GrpE
MPSLKSVLEGRAHALEFPIVAPIPINDPTVPAAMSASEQTSQDPQTSSQTPVEAGVEGAEMAPGASSAEQRLAELEGKHAEMADAYLRAKAEVENTRRRADEEVAKARKFALESFAESLLPVRDSLEAALTIANATPEQLLEGTKATLAQLSQALERNRIVEISPPAGTRFDPHQHQAISMVPAEQEANTVVAVLQKGYLIAERVLRPALVTVAAPK